MDLLGLGSTQDHGAHIWAVRMLAFVLWYHFPSKVRRVVELGWNLLLRGPGERKLGRGSSDLLSYLAQLPDFLQLGLALLTLELLD